MSDALINAVRAAGPTGIVVAVLVIGAVLMNLDLAKSLALKGWSLLKGRVIPAESPDTADDAFHAAKVLIAHYETMGCQEGLKAAREAGRHLFDAPGEHA